MGIFDNIQMALASLWANKMRAILTMLGIIIGIGSVIAIVTVGDSLTGSFTNEMSGVGARNVTVELRPKPKVPESQSVSQEGQPEEMYAYDPYMSYAEPEEKDLLTDAMIADYRAAFRGKLKAVSVTEDAGNGKVTNGPARGKINLMGVSPDYQTLNKIEIIAGRFITDKDSAKTRKIAVVSDRFVQDVYGANVQPADVIGRKFDADLGEKNLTLYIAGVYRYVQQDGAMGWQKDNIVTTNLYMPVNTAKNFNGKPAGYRSITALAENEVDNAQFLTATNDFFASYYTRNEKITVEATSMESMMKSYTKMLSTIKLAISAIAAISLLVGGIGVMNIMLVSITERTREIGVRKALGAPGRVIRMQFIVEAVVICLIGGIIGIIIGVALGSFAAGLMKYAARPSITAILSATGFSMAIGVFFGYYPSSKAAKMDPIDALRYE